MSGPCQHWEETFSEPKSFVAFQKIIASGNFQKQIAKNNFPCHDCLAVYDLDQMWLCLQCACSSSNSARCGRNSKSHAIAHHKASKHAVTINLKTCQFWCYGCDSEIPDSSNENGTSPQDVRRCVEPVQTSNDDKTAEADVVDEEESVDWHEYFGNSRGGLTGLANLGNTCFLNAGLQVLLHCPALVGHFSDAQALDLDADEKDQRKQLAYHFSTLVRQSWSGHYKQVAPRDIIRDICTLNPFFVGYGQHDSPEFVRCFLDHLHDGLKVPTKPLPPKYSTQPLSKPNSSNNLLPSNAPNPSLKSSKSPPASPKEPYSDQETHVFQAEIRRDDSTSIVSDIFQMQVMSEVRCSNCKALSVVIDTCYDLSLEIPHNKNTINRIGEERGKETIATPAVESGWFSSFFVWTGLASKPLSLQTCLHAFCTSEDLDQSNQYLCERCNQKNDALKILSLVSLPEVLCIHLKRFSHAGHFGDKVSRTVTFPLTGLDMSDFIKPIPIPVFPGQSEADAALNASTPSSSSSSSSSSASSVSSSSNASKRKKHKAQKKQAAAAEAAEEEPTDPKVAAKTQLFQSMARRKANVKEADKEKWTTMLKKNNDLYTCDDDGNCYDLLGLVKHMGSASGGHYIAFAKSHVTKKWYKFDDANVTVVTPETVSSQEAYMLMYGRQHSATRKSEMLSIVDAALAQGSTSSSGKQDKVRLVAEAWFKKLEYFSSPGPIDNTTLCCAHGYPLRIDLGSSSGGTQTGGKKEKESAPGGGLARHVSVQGWQSLLSNFGLGGPVCTGQKQDCYYCGLPEVRLKERTSILALQREASEAGDDDGPVYMLDDRWLEKWREFVNGGLYRPGPIENGGLFDPSDGVSIKPNLLKSKHYRGLNGSVWKKLVELYGGGPAIIRPCFDIYAEPAMTEEEAVTYTAEKKKKREAEEHESGGKKLESDTKEEKKDKEEEDDDRENNKESDTSEKTAGKKEEKEKNDDVEESTETPEKSSPGSNTNNQSSPRQKKSGGGKKKRK